MYLFRNSKRYESGRFIVNVLKFVNSKAGFDYTEKGSVSETRGNFSKLSDIIKSYALDATNTERSSSVSPQKDGGYTGCSSCIQL